MNIVLTGAGKGIGLETTKRLASLGAHRIIAVSRDISKIQLLDPVRVIPYALDLEVNDAEKELHAFVNSHFKSVDILINNAGYLINLPFEQQSSDDFDRQFNVNVKVPFLLIKELLPSFAAQAHIVNISSMGGFQGSAKFSGLSLYSAAKAALIALTESLAVELLPRNIAVNCLAMGAVQTEMLARAFPGYNAKMTPAMAAAFISDFAITGNQLFNGQILPVTLSNP
jgi:3-oxoacyl-[acyl-carrier protein] reductase